MSLQFKVWLYGTSTSKSEEKLVRIPGNDFAKAKGFHVFYKKSPRSQWKRLTEDLEKIPSIFRSKADKEIYIDSFVSTLEEALKPKEKKVAPSKPIPKPRIPEEPVFVEPIPEVPKEVELPSLPKEPRVTLTRKQFNAQMSRILFDELDLENMKWRASRIDNFINKLWRGYSHAPHLIASEEFRRGLVSQEIKRIKDRALKKKQGEMEEAYRKELEDKNVSLDAGDVSGDVKVQFKEVFNTQYLKPPLTPEEQEKLTLIEKEALKKEELTIKTLQDGLVVDKERQAVFAQVIVDYDQSILVGKDSLFGKNELANIAFDKVRSDMMKLFEQSIEKGLFRKSDEPEYSFRVLVPLVDAKGEIPTTALSKKGKKRTGHGFSTPRVKIKSRKDLKLAIDELFEAMIPALTRYIKINHAAGFMISGFSLERIIR